MASVPEAVRYVADLMAGFRHPWFLCGGWAVDAWLGYQSRDHGDVDIVVFHDDQRAVFDHLDGWELIAHDPHVPDDTNEPWDGRHLDLPAHIHVPHPRSTLASSSARFNAEFEFEFLLNERSTDEWVLAHEPRVALPIGHAVKQSAWQIPTALPEIALFYKAGGHLAPAEAGDLRPHDELDFLALLPILTTSQRTWLRDALTLTHPAHPWLTQLAN
ncbi:hypothetical protein ABN028_32535 [Actinopolymorpha sp. B17G11]|uniref:nucleotidyltransferase domain-containing protein n=1 Tax=unclassified Actinopolymorpha TaxID=2627063 RepID=UPI0032D9006A